MRSAMRSADMPGPGSRFGQDVTMRHFCVCARRDRAERARTAGGNAGADGEIVAEWSCRLSLAEEMMQRPVAVTDLERVGSRDRRGDIVLGLRGPLP